MSVNTVNNRTMIGKYGIAIAVSVMICILSVIISGCIVFSFSDPAGSILPAAMTSFAISSLVSGYLTSKVTKDGPMSGCIVGVILTLISALVSLILFERTFPAGISFALHTVQVLLCILGSLIASRRKKKYNAAKKYKKMKR